MARLSAQATDIPGDQGFRRPESISAPAIRIKSEELFQQQREVEIDHQGRIYRLRLTQLNKLILTA
jgi:hemin uptake protein HemP